MLQQPLCKRHCGCRNYAIVSADRLYLRYIKDASAVVKMSDDVCCVGGDRGKDVDERGADKVGACYGGDAKM